VPLREGRNRVGRGTVGSRPYGEWPKPPAVEQAQWGIHCQAGEAQVWDASSTKAAARKLVFTKDVVETAGCSAVEMAS
jgi:hypothetical protein